MSPAMIALINTGISVLPSILAFLKVSHAAANPTAPPLTDAQALAALSGAIAASLNIDQNWLASHPA